MNFMQFKFLVDELSDSPTDEQLANVMQALDSVMQLQRKVVEDELADTLARVAELQAKLGGARTAPLAASAPPPVRPPRTSRAQPSGDFTDADLGGDDDGDGDEESQSSFLAGLAEARASGAAKRRRLS